MNKTNSVISLAKELLINLCKGGEFPFVLSSRHWKETLKSLSRVPIDNTMAGDILRTFADVPGLKIQVIDKNRGLYRVTKLIALTDFPSQAELLDRYNMKAVKGKYAKKSRAKVVSIPASPTEIAEMKLQLSKYSTLKNAATRMGLPEHKLGRMLRKEIKMPTWVKSEIQNIINHLEQYFSHRAALEEKLSHG